MSGCGKLCECGCGLPSPICTHTSVKRGVRKGEPCRFVSGHALRGQPSYPRPPIEIRFWSKVDKRGPTAAPRLGPCWIWTGGRDRDGYGQTWHNKMSHKAHRVAWLLATNEWPKPFALHHCDNPSCVRFSHLFQGTPQENTADMISKGRWRKTWTKKPVVEKITMAKL